MVNNNKGQQMLLRWFEELNKSKHVAYDKYLQVMRKLTPYTDLYDVTMDQILLPVLKDQTCTSYGQFKELINLRIKKIKKDKFNK